MQSDNGLQIQVVGMPWYKRENYERIRSMFEDGNKLPETYDKWLAAAENGRISIESKGNRVLRVNVEPDEFAAWCTAKGMKLNSAARLSFANEAAFKSLGAQ